MDEGSKSYNVSAVVRLQGILEKSNLENTIKKLVNRHEALRTSFETVSGKPVQRIYKELDFELVYYEAAEEEAGEIAKHFVGPFELGKAPLLRVGLIRTAEDNHLLMADMHHIIADGVSAGVFVKDFISLYNGEELPPLTLQYKDVSQWQDSEALRQTLRKQEVYWLERFAGEIPVMDLPTDYPRPAVKDFKGKKTVFDIHRELTARIKKQVSQSETTLYIFLLAVYSILFSKYTGREDIVVGSPVTGRRHPDVQNIIGMFVNMLVMRNQCRGGSTFSEFLKETGKNALDAFENQDYQFEELVNQLGVQRDPGRNPLFDVTFQVQNIDIPELRFENLKLTDRLTVLPYEREYEESPFDLTILVDEVDDGLKITVIYADALFQRATVEEMNEHYIEILEQVTANREIKLEDITISFELASIIPGNHMDDEEDFNF
jgi:hypothetical protein